jgi:hypothetical protein
LNQEDISHIKRSITNNEIEAWISLSTKKKPGLMYSLTNSTRALKRKTNTRTPQTLPWNRKGWSSTKLTCKPNSATRQKDHTPCSSFYSRFARMVQHM